MMTNGSHSKPGDSRTNGGVSLRDRERHGTAVDITDGRWPLDTGGTQEQWQH